MRWPYLAMLWGGCVRPDAPADTLPSVSCPPHTFDDPGECQWDHYPGTAFMGYPFVGGSNTRRCAVATPMEEGCAIAFPWSEGECPTDNPADLAARDWFRVPESEQHQGRWYQRYVRQVYVYDPGPDHEEIVYAWTAFFHVTTGEIALIDIENEGPMTAFCCGDSGIVGQPRMGGLRSHGVRKPLIHPSDSSSAAFSLSFLGDSR